MPNCASAKKRLRQNERSRLRNKSVKSEIKTLTKKLLLQVENGEADEARQLLPIIVSKMDKAARRAIYHQNTIARKKASLVRALSRLDANAES